MYAWLSRARNSNKTITRYDLDDVSRSKFLSTNSVIDFEYFQDACPSFVRSSKEEIYEENKKGLRKKDQGGLDWSRWSDHFHACSTILPPLFFFLSFLLFSFIPNTNRSFGRKDDRFKRMETDGTVTVNCRLRIKGRHYADSLGLGNVACTFLSRNYTRSEKEREETEARKWWTVESQLIRGVGSVDAGPTDGGGISDGCWG